MSYVTFPGLAGNYAATPDVNLLDADTAHIQQGTGLWTAGALSTAQAYFGDSSLLVTGGVSTAVTPVTDAAAMGCRIWSAAGDTFDINGGTPVVVPAGVWTVLDADTGSAGTYTVNAAGSADYHLDAAYVAAAGPFVPSLRIVGDLDITLDCLAAQWSTGSDQAPIGRTFTTGDGWYLTNYRADNRLRLWVNTVSGGLESALSLVGSLQDGVRAQIRATFAAGTGAIGFTVDGVDKGGASVTASALDVSTAADLIVGRYRNASTGLEWAGDMYSAEVRDGIDGPIVAQFDAADVGSVL